nr:hypothetical protein [uncultured Allomuricauda sp.]
MKVFYLPLICVFLLSSCKFLDSKEYLDENSAWFMDSIEFMGKDVKYKMMGNALIFEDDYCSVPLEQTGMEKGDDISSWKVDEENHLLTIRSKNKYFNRTFEFCFKEDKEDNVIELYMVSDSVTILAHSPNKLESGLIEPPFLCNN